jgi:hypothetical protein
VGRFLRSRLAFPGVPSAGDEVNLTVAIQVPRNPEPYPKPETRNPKPETRNPEPLTLNPEPQNMNLNPSPLNLTLYPTPQTLNPECQPCEAAMDLEDGDTITPPLHPEP